MLSLSGQKFLPSICRTYVREMTKIYSERTSAVSVSPLPNPIANENSASLFTRSHCDLPPAIYMISQSHCPAVNISSTPLKMISLMPRWLIQPLDFSIIKYIYTLFIRFSSFFFLFSYKNQLPILLFTLTIY